MTLSRADIERIRDGIEDTHGFEDCQTLDLATTTLALFDERDEAQRMFGDAQHHAYSEKQERQAAEARATEWAEACGRAHADRDAAEARIAALTEALRHASEFLKGQNAAGPSAITDSVIRTIERTLLLSERSDGEGGAE